MSDWNSLNAQIIACTQCSRLREYGAQVARDKRRAYATEDYWGRPVPNFGDSQAKILIVGLAPGAHGAHRTGRMFTGDRSGDFLYAALHRAGLANQPTATAADDGLQLTGVAITAACHCAPPANKPTPAELANCRPWFKHTLEVVPAQAYIGLGAIGFNAIINEAAARNWWNGKRPRFAHGASITLTNHRRVVGIYHPSQQNTFTGKVTPAMYDAVFAELKKWLAER